MAPVANALEIGTAADREAAPLNVSYEPFADIRTCPLAFRQTGTQFLPTIRERKR